uniref:BTB domain-containing protein n=1 Tax=Panagrolaimus davidi TaxID=227884 RepID=A0A914PTK1_9BILA
MQQERFEIFESQDPENEHFDVTFEIEGKTLLANKLLLTSASEYMNSFLSDRWTKKDEPVKIEDYSYDNFYEFLRFLYLGSCNLTAENVFKLIDLAEFTGTERFLSSKKSFVDFLSSVNTSSRYSLNFLLEEKVFRAVYKWTENQVMKQKDADDKNFDLLEAVKDELRKTFPLIFSMEKSKMSKDFLMHFMGTF